MTPLSAVLVGPSLQGNLALEYLGAAVEAAGHRAELVAFESMADAPACARRIIDISGDGPENAGSPTGPARRAAERAGVLINAIAIEAIGVSTTQYYLRNVVTSAGFVLTARRHTDYPRAIREKIKRELARVTG